MTQPFLEIVEHAVEVGPVARPGRTRTAAGEALVWDETGFTVGGTRMTAEELVSIQLSRSVEHVMPRGLAAWIGEPPRRVVRVHVQLRRRDGLRVRLCAEVGEQVARGLPELDAGGERIDLDSLRAVALTALAAGATPVRFEASVVRAEEQGRINRVVEFSDDRAPLERSGRWGFVNGDGHVVVPCMYDEVTHFSEGRAAVRVGTRWGYIDLYGRWVVEPAYDSARPFWRGVAWASHRGDRVALSREGRRIKGRVRPEYTAFFAPFCSGIGMIVAIIAMLAVVSGQPMIVLGVLGVAATSAFSVSWWTSREVQRALHGRPRMRRLIALPRA